MRGSKWRDFHARLCKNHGMGGVRMDDAADLRKGLIQLQMRRGVGRGTQRSFHDASFQIDHHHIRWLHALIRHAGWLDDDEAPRAVDPAHISPSIEHHAAAGKLKIGLTDGFLQCFKHRHPPRSPRHDRKGKSRSNGLPEWCARGQTCLRSIPCPVHPSRNSVPSPQGTSY